MDNTSGRRGEYGLDGNRPQLGLAVQAVLELGAGAVAARAARSGRPVLATASGLAAAGLGAMTASYLYTTRRGKFGVWAGLLDDLGLRGDEHVLDIGCGRGAVLLLAAERVPGGRAVGSDIWRPRDQAGNSRAAAERNARLEGVAERVEFVHADARDLPFEPGTFDVVTSALTIHNIPSPEGRYRALDEAMRVLRPGGRLLVADFWPMARKYAAHLGHGTLRPLGPGYWYGGPWFGITLLHAVKEH